MYRGKSITELQEQLQNGETTKEELFEKANQLAHYFQDEYNSYVTILDKAKFKDTTSPLCGIPYGFTDNFSTSGILTTASSNILKDYVPVYDSTVYKKLKKAGATLVGKTVLDELAMGGSGTTGHTGIVRNPWNKERQIGGSSAGSASSVVLGITPFSIGSDTGDSVRKPAAYGGIVGFKPTYGRISRYGMFAFASSMDHVAMFTRNVKDAAIVTTVLKGKDSYDMVTINDDGKNYVDTLEDDIKGRKLFYIKEICDKEFYPDCDDTDLMKTLDAFHEFLEKCKTIGFEVESVSIDKALIEAIKPTYDVISCAEATSNNANLTGIQFGPRGKGDSIEEIMFNARTEGFSELIKRRFVMGSFILQKENQDKLFLNAGRVRRLVVDKINELFKTYDGLILPAAGGLPSRFDETSEKLSPRFLLLENHLAIGNFGGFPSITLPYGEIESMPIGINITGRVKEDDLVLNMSHQIEKITGYKDRYCKVGDIDV